MLKNAPMFKNMALGTKGKGIGLGRGKATVTILSIYLWLLVLKLSEEFNEINLSFQF